mgnify:CR=1 FL=1
MILEDEYLGRITPDEAREVHSRAESDCEHMPSAAWRALHTVGQMHYEYAVQVETRAGDAYVYWDDDGTSHLTWHPTLADWWVTDSGIEKVVARAAKRFGWPARVARRLVSKPEVAE